MTDISQGLRVHLQTTTVMPNLSGPWVGWAMPGADTCRSSQGGAGSLVPIPIRMHGGGSPDPNPDPWGWGWVRSGAGHRKTEDSNHYLDTGGGGRVADDAR